MSQPSSPQSPNEKSVRLVVKEIYIKGSKSEYECVLYVKCHFDQNHGDWCDGDFYIEDVFRVLKDGRRKPVKSNATLIAIMDHCSCLTEMASDKLNGWKR